MHTSHHNIHIYTHTCAHLHTHAPVLDGIVLMPLSRAATGGLEGETGVCSATGVCGGSDLAVAFPSVGDLISSGIPWLRLPPLGPLIHPLYKSLHF